MAPATQLPGRAERTPLPTRLFVVLFLAVFTACGAAGIEAWPFTGWRLFSNVRTDEQAAWRASAVDGGGREEQIRFDELPRGYRNFVLVMNAQPSLPEAERDAICRTWADALRRRGTTSPRSASTKSAGSCPSGDSAGPTRPGACATRAAGGRRRAPAGVALRAGERRAAGGSGRDGRRGATDWPRALEPARACVMMRSRPGFRT